MKKTTLFLMAILTISLSGCWGKEEKKGTAPQPTQNKNQETASQQESKFNTGAKSCDQYLSLMDCVQQKAPGNVRESYKKSQEQLVESLKTMPTAKKEATCKETMDTVKANPMTFKQYGCEVK